MKIDILMATYNGEKYLEEQLESILNQSFTDFRLIISDDCSSDSTKDILNKFAERDNRIVVYYQNENLGVAKNFEFLMGKVESDYFMFSDQDDFWKKDKIKNSIELMENKKCDIVYTDLEIVDENLNCVDKSYWKRKGFSKKVKYNNFESLYLNNYITGCTMLVKSKWLDKILPLPNESKYILHDYWIALIISKFGKMEYLSEPQILYRQHGENRVGSKRKSDEINDFENIRKLFIDVKLDHFSTFINKSYAFEDELVNKLNEKSYKYYQKLEKNEKVNLDDKKLFWKLYKYEEFGYSFKNYLILNHPKLGKLLFKIKKRL